MNEYLPLATLIRLLSVLALVLAPHALRLPMWETALIVALLVWRGLAAHKQWRMPPTWLKLLLTLATIVAVVSSLGGIRGQTSGTALLCIMAALKLLEFKGRRDVMVVVFLMYFMLLTHFLFSQELWTVAYLFICVVATTAVLIECQHRGALPIRDTLRKGGSMVLQAVPLMLLLFVLFPRIPGPLWGLPADAGASRSGLADSMSPGDISDLILSEEVAFRVTFIDPLPPPKHRYWRGPVFDQFDGRAWGESIASSVQAKKFPAVEIVSPALRYEITLEAQRTRWLFALDIPDQTSIPYDAVFGRDAQLMSDSPIIDRRRYTLRSHPEYRLDPGLSERQQQRYLRLPKGFNPRTIELARDLSAQSADASALIRSALRLFSEQNFVYTLRPPPLARDSVDDFLFNTRRGFCEHYASAFTVLMRAAGLPARIVTGYQGGQLNEIGDYYVVRQSDAHAWSEVWLAGQGWVRVDPTAAVAPERIELNLEAALGDSEELPSFLANRTRFKYYFAARWDWINAQWNGLVLGYGPELQQQFLKRFGLGEMREMILALTIGITVVLAVFGAMTVRKFAPAHSRDPVLREWQRLTRRLARNGLPQHPHEGPLDYARRVATARPEWAAQMQAIATLYMNARYIEAPDHAHVRDMARAVRAFRWSKASSS
ncbi:MAG: DUF3488 and transglutaminase-like domain-containing protein [Pseudomonadota bacterium]|nr:DUF3488 and transglutaminase-like domain-containing protein [Pseudomonadota bacterium]